MYIIMCQSRLGMLQVSGSCLGCVGDWGIGGLAELEQLHVETNSALTLLNLVARPHVFMQHGAGERHVVDAYKFLVASLPLATGRLYSRVHYNTLLLHCSKVRLITNNEYAGHVVCHFHKPLDELATYVAILCCLNTAVQTHYIASAQNDIIVVLVITALLTTQHHIASFPPLLPPTKKDDVRPLGPLIHCC